MAPAAERDKGGVRWLLFAPLLIHLNLVLAWLTHANPFAGSPSAIERLITLGSPGAERPISQAEFQRQVAGLVGHREVYCGTWRRGRTTSATEWACAPGNRNEEIDAGRNCPRYRVTVHGAAANDPLRGKLRIKPIDRNELRPRTADASREDQRTRRRRETGPPDGVRARDRASERRHSARVPVVLPRSVAPLDEPWQDPEHCRRLTGG